MLQANPIQIQTLSHPLLQEKEVELAILRLDQVHSLASGNKFFKLRYNLEEAKRLGKDTILTFGGAFSNHIYATAAAAKAEGIKSIGIIRGEEMDPDNPTLAFAKKQGMQLHFVDRETYRRKASVEVLQELGSLFGDFYLIPEGGTNERAIQGTREIQNSETKAFTHIACSIGTGGTFAGLAESLPSNQSLWGFSSLKGNFIHQEIETLLQAHQISCKGSLKILDSYHFGGYGKWKPELIEFIGWFHQKFGVPLDPIYTGKMAFGLWDLIQKDQFPRESKILLIHSGGLQGNAGFEYLNGISLPIL